MTLHQLKIFGAVAEHLNITKVSRKLQVSQPSVSKQLRLLEQEYGLKFYVKSGRGIKLTQEGQLFQVTVKPILEQMEGLKRTFENRVAEGRAKSLMVGSSPSPAAFFLSAVLKSFVELHPTVHPTLRTGYPPAIEEMVLNAEVEMRSPFLSLIILGSLPNQFIPKRSWPLSLPGIRWLRKENSTKPN